MTRHRYKQERFPSSSWTSSRSSCPRVSWITPKWCRAYCLVFLRSTKLTISITTGRHKFRGWPTWITSNKTRWRSSFGTPFLNLLEITTALSATSSSNSYTNRMTSWKTRLLSKWFGVLIKWLTRLKLKRSEKLSSCLLDKWASTPKTTALWIYATKLSRFSTTTLVDLRSGFSPLCPATIWQVWCLLSFWG